MSLCIRSARPDDGAELVAIYAPYVLNTAISFEYDVPTEEEFRRRIEQVLEKFPYLVAEDGSGILGYAYAHAFHQREAYSRVVEVSIYVRQDAHRLGLGRRLYEELEARLRAQGIIHLVACVAAPETEDEYLTHNSRRFHERMGYSVFGHFKSCGYKFGRWYGMLWMGKQIGDLV